MIRKVAIYFAFVAGLGIVVAWFQRADVTPGRFVIAMLFAALASWLIWLRWDWAPARAHERLAKQKANGE